MDKTKGTGAENVRWNLADLYTSTDSPEIKADIADIQQRATDFEDKYRGNIDELSAEQLLNAVEEYNELAQMGAKIGTFSFLNWVTDTADAEAGQFMAKIQQLGNQINQQVLFFDLEWQNASEETAALMDGPALQEFKHYLHLSRESAPYSLSEKEEQIVSELAFSGVQGWNRYFSEVMSKARYYLDGDELTQGEVLQHMHSADREMRKKAADSMTEGLERQSHATTYVFNMLASYKASMDKKRGYSSWVSPRNISNQVNDETVENLIQSVTSRYDIVARYYHLVKDLLGYDELYDYDRYAPVATETTEYDWEAAKEIVLEAYSNFDQQAADIVTEFFDKNWIDAPMSPNKRSGAFSHSVVPTAHPYILLNYDGTDRAVMTLAHELGHGIHQYVARRNNYLHSNTPLTTSEMASTFGEMLVFEEMMARTSDPKVRLSMRLAKISDTFATVFRQVAMNRFEDGMHSAVRERGLLTTEDFSEIWLRTQRDMFGDSVNMRDDYGLWWSYIPHFLGSPGYVYAYSFGELLVWTLYAKYQEEGGDFPQRYMEALAGGGSVYPDELLAPLGVNLKDPDFWNGGLQLIEDMVIEAEKEAAELD